MSKKVSTASSVQTDPQQRPVVNSSGGLTTIKVANESVNHNQEKQRWLLRCWHTYCQCVYVIICFRGCISTCVCGCVEVLFKALPVIARNCVLVCTFAFLCLTWCSYLHQTQPTRHWMFFSCIQWSKGVNVHKQLVPHDLIREWLTGRTSFPPRHRLDYTPSRLLTLPGMASSSD